MKRSNWSGPIDIFENLEDVIVVILSPKEPGDEKVLVDAIHDAGIEHRLSFTDGTTSLRVDFPSSLRWTDTGGMTLCVTDGQTAAPAYFWVIEVSHRVSKRKPQTYVWWSRHDDPSTATTWN